MPSTRNESLRDNINAAKTLVIILIVFFVCWFPFFLTYILSFVGKVSRNMRMRRPTLCTIISIICDLEDNGEWTGL